MRLAAATTSARLSALRLATTPRSKVSLASRSSSRCSCSCHKCSRRCSNSTCDSRLARSQVASVVCCMSHQAKEPTAPVPPRPAITKAYLATVVLAMLPRVSSTKLFCGAFPNWAPWCISVLETEEGLLCLCCLVTRWVPVAVAVLAPLLPQIVQLDLFSLSLHPDRVISLKIWLQQLHPTLSECPQAGCGLFANCGYCTNFRQIGFQSCDHVCPT